MKVLKTNKSAALKPSNLSDDSLEILKLILTDKVSARKADKVARALLINFGDLYSVIHASDEQLAAFPGLPIDAALELQQTRKLIDQIGRSCISHMPLIDSLDRVKQFCRLILGAKRREEFHVLFLDSSYHLLGHECLQIGTLDHVMVYPRELMHRALTHYATYLILVHNHPTGHAGPSTQDISMTEQLQQAGALLKVSILDHIIIGFDGEFSFRKNGLLNKAINLPLSTANRRIHANVFG